MSENQPQKPNSGKIVHAQAVSYSGPIPLPTMLEEYNRIVPGSADRILRMAEEQTTHRHSLEKKVIGTDSRNSLLGIISAFIISLAALALAAYAIHLGQVGAGTFIGTTSFAALVAAFIYGTQSRKTERQNRDK